MSVPRVLLDDPTRLAPIIFSAATTIAAIAAYAAFAPADASDSVAGLALLACQSAFFLRAWDVLLLRCHQSPCRRRTAVVLPEVRARPAMNLHPTHDAHIAPTSRWRTVRRCRPVNGPCPAPPMTHRLVSRRCLLHVL